MTQKLSRKFVDGLPKAELHVHIEGTLEAEMEFAIAKRNQIDIGAKTPADIDRNYGVGLPEFLKAYYKGMQVLRTKQDFYDLTAAFLRKEADSNVKHLELFFDPQAHTSRGIPFATVIEGIHEAIVDAAPLDIDVQLIMCFLREYSQESAMQTLKEAEPYHKKGWILGVGLDSDEHHNPPLKFMLVFAKARHQGYYLTMHCDLHQVDSVDHIKQALEIITVDRLDHGLNIVENADLMTFLIDQKIGITACPMAYFYTRKVMEQEAINKLFNSGALISFNSDDPAYKGSNYINDVYYKFAQKCDWSEKELIRIAQNSFKTSWISQQEKEHYLAQIDKYISSKR